MYNNYVGTKYNNEIMNKKFEVVVLCILILIICLA